MSANNYETAICFFINGEKTPLKYRNILNRANFIKFVQKSWPGVQYINFYNKKSKAYTGRVWIQ